MNLQEISADALRSESFWLAIICMGLSIVSFVLAIASGAINGKWYHPKKLLVILTFIAVGIGLMVFSEHERQLEGKQYNEKVSTRTAEVHNWLHSEYGATASDDVAKSVYLAMYYQDYTESFLLEGSEGVIEVTLAVTDDGEFHIMHNSAEVSSSSK